LTSWAGFLLQKLVRLTGGDIVVDSEEGEGSVFKFSLMLPTSGQRGDLQKLSLAMTRTPSGFGDERIRGIRVLLVDANPVRQVQILRFWLSIWLGICQSVRKLCHVPCVVNQYELDLTNLFGHGAGSCSDIFAKSGSTD
jgi:hypothetical protein